MPTSRLIKEIIEDIKKASLVEKDTINNKEIKDFKEIKQIKSSKKVCFIDGGNMEILSASDFSVSLIRIHRVIYKNNKRINYKRQEFFCLIQPCAKVKIFSEKKTVLEQEFELKHDDKLSEAADKVRRLAELRLAQSIDSDFILIDGDLETKFEEENKEMKKLLEKNNIYGIAKTCSLRTDQSKPIVTVLFNKNKYKAWYYYDKNIGSIHRFFIKLHNKSNYVFKFESNTKNVEEILSILLDNSKDPIFLGYPYGLIEADQTARIAKEEKNSLLARFIVSAGRDWDIIKQHINSMNAHDILDGIK